MQQQRKGFFIVGQGLCYADNRHSAAVPVFVTLRAAVCVTHALVVVGWI